MLQPVLEGLVRAMGESGGVDEDPSSLPRSVLQALRAEWGGFRPPAGRWIGADRDGELAARRIDFGLLERLPRGRLVRLAGPLLERSPRWAESGLREVVAYLDSAPARPRGIAVIALRSPLRADPVHLEGLLRAWMALESVRAAASRSAEQDRRLEAGTRAACALHDLRHELTIASLELERIAEEPGVVELSRLGPLRAALANARALCESETEVPDPLRVPLEEVLRREAAAARSVAGRGDDVRIELRVAPGLAFPIDRGILARIVRNLALNAIESSPDGESVVVEAHATPAGDLLVRVSDRGRGMSAADREELFRFGRSARGGWGIGTSSVESCARRIGAVLTIDSRPGSGTRVEITVPPSSNQAAG